MTQKYEPIGHRLDGLNVQEHYVKLIRRVVKYTRRLTLMGFCFDKKNDVFERGNSRVTLEYIEGRCDFTDAEFNARYKEKQLWS